MQESNIASSLMQRLSLGRYGGENIIWKVLAVDNDKILLISELGLEARGLNSQHFCSSTWEKCLLRKWLNEEFYFEAFSEEEREGILETIVSADTDHSTYKYSWPDTKDRLFLLSATEAELYFKDDADRKTHPTEYAEYHDADRIELYCTNRRMLSLSEFLEKIDFADGGFELLALIAR